MAPSERDSPAPRARRRSHSPAEERTRDDRRRHSGRDKEHSRRPSSPVYSDDEPRRKRHEYSRDSSRDRRRRREERDNSRDRKDRRRRDDYDSNRRRDRDRDDKRSSRHHRRRDSASRSRSPSRPRRDRNQSPNPRSRSPLPPPASRKSRGPLASQEASFRNNDPSTSSTTAPLLDADGKPIEKQKPNFNSTGLLAKEANTVAGTSTVLKYHEPPESRKPPPKDQWRIYVFKGPETLDTIHLFSRSCWLIGRDASICDYAVAHPSTSKQHAVIQFRYISKLNEFGEREGKVKPYIIDLESANGTKLNGKKVAASTYVELLDGDVLAFGESEREYVLMLPPP